MHPFTKCFWPSLMGRPETASVIYANKGRTRPHNSFTMTGSPLGCFNTGVQHQHFLLRRCHRLAPPWDWLHQGPGYTTGAPFTGFSISLFIQILHSGNSQIYHGHLGHSEISTAALLDWISFYMLESEWIYINELHVSCWLIVLEFKSLRWILSSTCKCQGGRLITFKTQNDLFLRVKRWFKLNLGI